jgi:predicted phosphoadenosine phosphosulfate sulfurtransferase
VPEKLARTNRAPSYKQIAIAILRNDFTLKALGFEGPPSEYYRQLKAEQKRKESAQMKLI